MFLEAAPPVFEKGWGCKNEDLDFRTLSLAFCDKRCLALQQIVRKISYLHPPPSPVVNNFLDTVEVTDSPFAPPPPTGRDLFLEAHPNFQNRCIVVLLHNLLHVVYCSTGCSLLHRILQPDAAAIYSPQAWYDFMLWNEHVRPMQDFLRASYFGKLWVSDKMIRMLKYKVNRYPLSNHTFKLNAMRWMIK